MKAGCHSRRPSALDAARWFTWAVLGPIGIYLLCRYGWALFAFHHS